MKTPITLAAIAALVIFSSSLRADCETIPNSTGFAAELTITPNADPLLVHFSVTGLPSSWGRLIYSPVSAAIPMGGGNLCVGPWASGSGYALAVWTSPDLSVQFDWGDVASPGVPAFAPGHFAQFWFRDPVAGDGAFNFSNAVETSGELGATAATPAALDASPAAPILLERFGVDLLDESLELSFVIPARPSPEHVRFEFTQRTSIVPLVGGQNRSSADHAGFGNVQSGYAWILIDYKNAAGVTSLPGFTTSRNFGEEWGATTPAAPEDWTEDLAAAFDAGDPSVYWGAGPFDPSAPLVVADSQTWTPPASGLWSVVPGATVTMTRAFNWSAESWPLGHDWTGKAVWISDVTLRGRWIK